MAFVPESPTPGPDWHDAGDHGLSPQLAALYAVAARLTSSASVDDVLTEVGRGVGRVMPQVGEVSVSVWDPRRGVIRDLIEFRPWSNRRVPLPPPAVHPVADLPEIVAVLTGDAGYAQCLVDDPAVSDGMRAYMRRWGWQAVLIVPMVANGRTLGIVEIVDPRRAAPFAPGEIRFCQALAASGAGALRQAQLYERVRRLADHDALTGLANPRTFRRRLAAAIRAANRSGEPLSILVLDIDDFKGLNDRNGHAHGDRVLQTTARVMNQHARVSDTAGRLGGDELGLILRGAGHEQAAALCDRLLDALGRRKVHVSIGAAAYPGHGRTADELIHAADIAMLAVKADGKHGYRLSA
jgi:diguanylate cyclase (GGDEF)-like protein